MITADTITDEQIRELRSLLYDSRPRTRTPMQRELRRAIDTCDIALGLATRLESTGLLQRSEARARCAELWNATRKP